MTRLIVLLSLLFSSVVWAQDEDLAREQQGDYQDQYVEETSPNDNNTVPEETNTDGNQQKMERVQVDCVCPPAKAPENEVAEAPSIFPSGTAVNIMPVPTDKNPASVQIKEREFPPAYVEKLPSGYSNNTFQPIGTSSQ